MKTPPISSATNPSSLLADYTNHQITSVEDKENPISPPTTAGTFYGTTFVDHRISQPENICRVCPILAGNSKAINDIRSLVERFAPTDAKALITGETGTGKELVAKEIHNLSKRKDKPFVPINCAAIPEEILESEFFGHEKGAFTDATKLKQGLFEITDGGTVFLDEIGELRPELQAKLLRALDTGMIRRIGALKETKVNIRFIAATNKDLEALVKDRKFNRGLRDSLNVFSVHMPPLRELREDIPLIAKHLLERNRYFVPDKVIVDFSPDAINLLQSYNWPGNVRELENVIRRAIIFAKGNTIESTNIFLNKDEAASKSIECLDDIALCNAPVFISGESGTGKELLAKRIHESSYRSSSQFVSVNCATIKTTLAESELFGHVKGAFTGATTSKIGLFEIANDGTVFLDEIGELNYEVQTKLLRVIQEGEIIPVGSNIPKKINFRTICSSSKDLEALVKSGRFREDLYHRLDVIPIKTVPLRGRNNEIIDLVEFFLAQFKGDKQILGFTPFALSKLTAYGWPGNIRELRSVIERAIILANEGESIDVEHIHFPSNGKNTETKSEPPILSEYRSKFIDFLVSNKPFDKNELKLLVLKWVILQRLLAPSDEFENISERRLSMKLQLHPTNINRLVKDSVYGSTQNLIKHLRSEIVFSERGGKLKIQGKENPSNLTSYNSIAQKYLTEFFTYLSEANTIDLDKIRLLAIKCRASSLIAKNGGRLKSIELANELGITWRTLRLFLEKFGTSPGNFIKELKANI